MVASDSKDGPIGYVPVSEGGKEYVARRLTPRECARCQGFDARWGEGLAENNPSDEDVAFFQKVWDDWNDLQGKKHKTEKQVRKWLATEPIDSAQYKMWGNGVALPCVEFIMNRIVRMEHGELEATKADSII